MPKITAKSAKAAPLISAKIFCASPPRQHTTPPMVANTITTIVLHVAILFYFAPFTADKLNAQSPKAATAISIIVAAGKLQK